MKERKLLYQLSRVYLAGLTAVIEDLRAEGVGNIPATGPVILACNHINWMDILSVTVPCPRPVHLMGKAELFEMPVLGGYYRLLGAFPVRRGEGDREALRQAIDVVAAGQVLCIMPEGHRSGTGVLMEGKSGVALIALRSGAPIVPVAIWGTEKALRGLHYGPFRPTVHVVYGEPFTLTRGGPGHGREDVERGINTIMLRIASMLPPEYRGVYAEEVAALATAGATTMDSGASGLDYLAMEQPETAETPES
jgi:1-acyl-sn-glycerol-3-phosphate acyltransferase